MAFAKITEEELAEVGVEQLDDRPVMASAAMKAKFEETAKQLLAPKFNALVEALNAATGAENLGAQAPEGLSGTNAQAVLEALLDYIKAHEAKKNNPHQVTAAQAGAYTRAETDEQINAKVVALGTGDMAQAVYDPDSLKKDLGVQLYTHTKTGTVHNFAGSGANGRALITAVFNAGDTVTLNGAPVYASCGPDPADGDTIVNGRWVSFVADEENGQINFKGGGGVGPGKLALANAAADRVSSGYTFYAGDKLLKTGSLPERGQYQYAGGVGGGGSGTTAYVAFNNIPEGIYRKNGADWAPEIRASKTDVYGFLGVPASVVYNFSGTVKGSGYTLAQGYGTGSFVIRGLPFARMVVNSRDGASASYSNGTLTISMNKATGEVTGYGNVSREVNWSIQVTMYLA